MTTRAYLQSLSASNDEERLMKRLGLSPALSDTDERRRSRAPPPQPPEELGRPNKVICPLWVSIDPHNPMMLRMRTRTGLTRRKMIRGLMVSLNTCRFRSSPGPSRRPGSSAIWKSSPKRDCVFAQAPPESPFGFITLRTQRLISPSSSSSPSAYLSGLL